MTATIDDDYQVDDTPVTGVVPTHEGIVNWVREIAALAQPDEIRYCDGSRAEWDELVELLVGTGTVRRLNPDRRPNSIYAQTDPNDVARVEDRTYICSASADDAGPTNNWMDPQKMKAILLDLFAGSMRGRTLYVIPFCMGPIDAPDPKFGVEITDSAYVVCSMHIMTRCGTPALAKMEETNAPFVPALHSVGMPVVDGVEDVPWPCSTTKYIVHFPEERSIWSYGSGYGGNSLLGKKCYALRIASVMGRDEGWMAEHMLIIKLISPEGKTYHMCAAFPSACGKTNLAMLEPTIPGWRAEMIGDDIAWLRVGPDGRLYATNPETGLFGVAPGTSAKTNPNAMRSIEGGNSIFTNVALTDDLDVWWEGMTDSPPEHLTDWRGRSWTPDGGPEGGAPGEKAAHPNSRFCTPIRQCPILSESFDEPIGVPIDAIIFGGRRAHTIPLVSQSRDWTHGVFMGATCSSETTAAAAGAVGVVRRDPMAMLPFIGYHVADYLRHWLDMAKATDPAKLPKVFYVNWFRKDADGRFLWPGFGENSRVLKWMAERIDGAAEAVETPAGLLPAPGSLDTDGLDLDADVVAEVTGFAADEWVDETPALRAWLESLGPKTPPVLFEQLARLEEAIGS